MADINSIPSLRTLYRILHRGLRNTRLELAENIHYVPLYKDNREGDSLKESFDPIGQDAVNGAMGYWCYTRLFYDERRTAIRRVPVGRGSWNQRNAAKLNITRDGQTWCTRKLTYDNFKMLQYSLGRVDDQPEYAICQLFRVGAQIVGDVTPDNSTHQGGTVGEPNEIDQGSLSGTKNNAIREPEEPLPSVTTPPSQNNNEHANLNKKRRYEIEDPSERTKWPIENDNIAEMLIMAVKFLLRQSTLQIRDPSDESEWAIENGKITEVLKMLMSALDKNTREIPQPNAAPPYIRIEDNPSTSQVQASQHGAAGTSNESAKQQDPNLSHQAYMPTQEGLHANYQYYQQSVISGTTLHPEVEQGLRPNDIFEQYVEFLNMDIEDNQPTMQFQAPQHGAAGIVNDSAMLQDQNSSHQPYDMSNQWNAHAIDPFYPPGESSTHYNQEFSDDDVNTSEPDFDG